MNNKAYNIIAKDKQMYIKELKINLHKNKKYNY